MFTSIISTIFNSIDITSFLVCSAFSLVLGFVIALAFMFRSAYSKGFCITLVLLPLLVQVVIMMVSQSVGAGIAVAGTFTLIRFRSAPGSAKELLAIFIAMAVGIINGAGYIILAALIGLIASLVMVLLELLPFARSKRARKTLVITVPEDLEYSTIFDDIFEEYAVGTELIGVRTKNMGSLYELTYTLTLKDTAKEKEMLDKLRTRNGNLSLNLHRLVPSDKPTL